MRQKKLASSKSKSQDCCYCGLQDHHFRQCPSYKRDVKNNRKHPDCLDPSCQWIGPGHWQHRGQPIASTPNVPVQPLSEPKAGNDIPLVHIGRYNGLWCICEGHVRLPIPNYHIAIQTDPVVAATHLITHANGPINVAWR